MTSSTRTQHGTNSTSDSPASVDDAYKSAIQPVVDNSMRTDILGPNFCKVLEDHTPARKTIIKLIIEEINRDPDLKKEVKKVIKEYNGETKEKWIDRSLGAVGTVIFALIVWAIEHSLTTATTVVHH